jgi:hypothetical protein
MLVMFSYRVEKMRLMYSTMNSDNIGLVGSMDIIYRYSVVELAVFLIAIVS